MGICCHISCVGQVIRAAASRVERSVGTANSSSVNTKTLKTSSACERALCGGGATCGDTLLMSFPPRVESAAGKKTLFSLFTPVCLSVCVCFSKGGACQNLSCPFTICHKLISEAIKNSEMCFIHVLLPLLHPSSFL